MTQRGAILSILVKVVDEYDEDLTHRYREVLARLGEVFGADPNEYRPVKVENMVFRWPPKGLKAEALATKGEQSYWRRLLWLYWNSFIQFLLEKFDLSGGGYDAPVYRQELRENSDYRRFDDTLRMVFDCTTEEVRAIDGVLSYFRSQNKVMYGLHQSDSALMMCSLFSLEESEHIHFIDGSDEGYALAARQLKQQLAEIEKSE